jgi:hypothetical protein
MRYEEDEHVCPCSIGSSITSSHPPDPDPQLRNWSLDAWCVQLYDCGPRRVTAFGRADNHPWAGAGKRAEFRRSPATELVLQLEEQPRSAIRSGSPWIPATVPLSNHANTRVGGTSPMHRLRSRWLAIPLVLIVVQLRLSLWYGDPEDGG